MPTFAAKFKQPDKKKLWWKQWLWAKPTFKKYSVFFCFLVSYEKNLESIKIRYLSFFYFSNSASCEILFNEISILEELERGGQGVVYKGVLRSRIVAIKQYFTDKKIKASQFFHLNHQNLIKSLLVVYISCFADHTIQKNVF